MSLGNQAVRGLATGSGVFAVGGTDALAAADAQSGGLIGVWNYATNDLSIIGSSSVPILAALKGKTIGITDKNSRAYSMPVLALAPVGLPANAAHYVVLSGPPAWPSALVTALVSGRIQPAAFHTDDGLTLISKDPNVHVLAQMSKIVPQWWYGAVSVKRSYAQVHPQVVEALLTAMMEAQRWMYTHSAQTIKVSVRDTGESPLVVAKAYEIMSADHNWVIGQGLSASEVTYTLNQFKKDGVVPADSSLGPAQVMDTRYIKAVLAKLGPGSY